MRLQIDSVESPGTLNKDDNFISPERCRKQLDHVPSPNSFDSAKKRKKVWLVFQSHYYYYYYHNNKVK